MISEAHAELIEALCAHYADEKGSDVEVLRALDFILHDSRKVLEATVDTLGDDGQSHSVKEFKSISCGRKFWKVRGSHDKEYTCLQSYCSCPSFLMQARQIKHNATCKHMLAVRMASMMGTMEYEEISDDRFVELVCQETSNSGVVSSKPFRTWRK
jgi:predicted nucleic acid-binding Zn finger protein